MKPLVLLTLAALAACSGGGEDSSTSSSTETGSGTGTGTSASTAGVLCDFSQRVANDSPSVRALSTVTWSCDGTTRSVVANGLPDHDTGTFPNADNPNAISAQAVAGSVTLAPVATDTVTPRGGPRALGWVLNGVKVDPDTAGTCDDSGASCTLVGGTGAWHLEAMGQTAFRFGTDDSNAHVQPGGAYHYHGIPEGFLTRRNGAAGVVAMTLVGWAADGFPIYARYGHDVANDVSTPLRAMKPSWHLKASPDATRPPTALYAMGTFKEDYEYVAGSGDLDECNGRTGVTPEFPAGIYHYVATDTWPYLQRCVKGKVA